MIHTANRLWRDAARTVVSASTTAAPAGAAVTSSSSSLLTKKRLLATVAAATSSGSSSSGGDRVVVLGCGWGGFQLGLYIDQQVPLTVISPRNHFVFTPLLASTAVGTLEFRAIQEPVRTILGPKGKYLQAEATHLDAVNKKLTCQSIHKVEQGTEESFEVEYDKLVIAVGVQTNTFGIESIKEGDGIYFMKQLHHARAVRINIIDSFEKAALPGITEAERRRLLSFLMVGGGPTSCEFTAELHDFIKNDVKRLYSDLLPYVKITLVEAGPALLGPFDKALQDYAFGLFKNRDIDVRLGTAVTGVDDFHGEGYHFPAKRAQLSDGSSLEFGTMVWSAGLAPTSFTESLDGVVPRNPRNKRILVDEYLRVKGHEGSIWAIGDAAVPDVDGVPLPQIAQVARQQGIYLAKILNGKAREDEKPFKFFSLGSMAFMGDMKGIVDSTSAGPHSSDPTKQPLPKDLAKRPKVTGLLALFMWRFAYWGRQTSITNKLLIPMYWFKSFFFGRDISRF